MIWVESGGGGVPVARGGKLDHFEPVCVQMASKRWQYDARVDADDVSQLAMGAGTRRNRVHRFIRIARDKRQHLEAAPAEHALSGGQPRLAPIGINLGSIFTAFDYESFERAFHRIRQRVGPPFRNADGAIGVGD